MRLSVVVASTLALLPLASSAGEKVAGTDTFTMNERQWPIEAGKVFWILQNSGVSVVNEGPLEPGPVECHGSGFWSAGEQRGEGICIYGDGDDTYFQVWEMQPFGSATWRIVNASGKYEGLTGQGRSASRTESGERITDWVGEVAFPN